MSVARVAVALAALRGVVGQQPLMVVEIPTFSLALVIHECLNTWALQLFLNSLASARVSFASARCPVSDVADGNTHLQSSPNSLALSAIRLRSRSTMKVEIGMVECGSLRDGKLHHGLVEVGHARFP